MGFLSAETQSVSGGSGATPTAQWDAQTAQALVAGFLAIAVKQHQQLTRKRA